MTEPTNAEHDEAVDRLLRDAGARLRASAPDEATTATAWEFLDDRDFGRRRLWWMAPIVLAATAASVLAIVLVTRTGETVRDVPADTPAPTIATTMPAPTIATTMPAPTIAATVPTPTSAAPASVPAATTAPTTTSGPTTTSTPTTTTTTTATLSPVPRVIVADPPIQPAATPEVLYEAGTGAAVNELGIDDCQECDPTRPLSPVVTSDGTVIIADLVNARWISVRDGVPSATPFPANTSISSILAGPGDVIYAVTTVRTLQAWDLQLVALDPTDLSTVIAEHDLATHEPFTRLRLQGTQILVLPNSGNNEAFPLVEQGPAPPPVIAPRMDQAPAQFDVTVNGHTITWQMPPGDHNDDHPQSLADGSVMLRSGTTIDDPADPRRLIVVRPDGTSAAAAFTGISDAFNSYDSFTTSHDAVLQLGHTGTTWQVLRYPPR